MRYLLVVAPLAAVAAARNWIGVQTEWATHPQKTADWYREHDQPLPELASTITTVEANKSFVVKLECLGCPFRVRTLHEVYETWQNPPQDNSLLLNLTIDDAERALLLNGNRIAPLAPMPLGITAFQTPANLSHDTMEKMTEMEMLDDSFDLGTRFGKFALQYEHSLVAVRGWRGNWLQFDVTGVHHTSVNNPGSYKLEKEGQNMIQVYVDERNNGEELYIRELQVVNRKDRLMPIKMDCGKDAILKTEFNPLEWDYYGQFGTLTRSWHMLLWGTGAFFSRNGGILILTVLMTGLMTGLASLIRRRFGLQNPTCLERVDEDAEAGLLAPEYEEPPPEYEDVPELEGKEEKA